MKLISLTKELAEKFYSIHKEKPFFTNLCEYMCSGPIIVMSLKKDNAVEDFRKLIGSTDPEKAEEVQQSASWGSERLGKLECGYQELRGLPVLSNSGR